MKSYLKILVLFLAVVGLVVWLRPAKPTVSTPKVGEPKSRQSQPVTPIDSSAVPAQPSGEASVQQPGGSYEPSDTRWRWWNEMEKKDRYFEWKMPINFYGRVLDQKDHPVGGATVKFTWTDLSPAGSSNAEALSDGSGSFALTGKQGKRLVVDSVTKEGYYLSKTENQFSYEYAAFFEDIYHRPDPKNPVIFRMRKKTEAEPLAHHQAEITVGAGRAGVVQLDQGTALQVDLLANGDLSAKNWSARVSVSGGGIQTSKEEFPFTAPENGYQSSVILDFETPKPRNWTDMYQGGQFYVKTATGQYGRIELKAVPGKTFMRYSFFLNPTPGSRNLEYDSKKKVP